MKNIDAIFYIGGAIVYATLLFGGIAYGFADIGSRWK